MEDQNTAVSLSRRGFMKTAAAGAVTLAAGSQLSSRAYAAGGDKIRLGVIGCGGRGTHDSSRCLAADDNVELISMGDIFPEQVQRCRKTLALPSRPSHVA